MTKTTTTDKDRYTIGIDFGTNSVRAIVVRCADGFQAGSSVWAYESGHDGVILDPNDPNLARQSPSDYVSGLEFAVRGALAEARSAGVSMDRIIGIGTDTTGSTPLPVDSANQPLALDPRWETNPAAMAWLWKDHTAADEAERITQTAREVRPQYVDKYGGVYSSEWFWSKIWRCLNVAPDVFEAANSWVELADYIPSLLCGVTNPLEIRRGVCAAGHKAMYNHQWGGLPEEEFLSLLHPKLADLRRRLYNRAHMADSPAGTLSQAWADRLGLPPGLPVAIGALDAHLGAVGAGIAEGVLVKILGTSTCDIAVSPADRELPDIPGICGTVMGSVLPGYYGLEAGQSAVGDLFRWLVDVVLEEDAAGHQALTRDAQSLRPGQSGLLALDWNNGNRCILVDPRLSGLLIGQTLHTTRAEIYRALIEATAFGARAIIERIEEYCIPVNKIVCCGGIARKNSLLMQIYADVTGRIMEVSGVSESCAHGAAISAAVAAGKRAGGYDTFESAQRGMITSNPILYHPDPHHAAVYDQLYRLYRMLHDGFGRDGTLMDFSGVMKELITIKGRRRPDR